MESAVVRIGMIAVGAVIIAVSGKLNADKKILVNYAVIWGLAGVLLILTGIIPALSSWTGLLAPGTVAVFFGAGILVLIALFQNSLAISQIALKNRELAMHVALLNQECEQLIKKVEELNSSGKADNEKDTFHG